jgi:hypothetical protein
MRHPELFRAGWAMTGVVLDAQGVAALKTATRALVARLGGLEAAASVCRLQVSRLAECQSLNHPGALLPIDVVVQLEAVAEEPVVSRVLLGALGLGVAVPGEAVGASIGQAVAAMTRGAGDAAAEFMEARADGVVDVAEETRLRERFTAVRDGADAALAALPFRLPLRGGK